MNVIGQASILFAFFSAVALPASAQNADIDTLGGGGVASGAPVAITSIGKPVDDAREIKIRAALKRVNPDVNPEYIGFSSAPGLLEVIVKGQVVFVSEDGSYLVQGLYDLTNQRDVAQVGAMPVRRKAKLEEIPKSERIVFAPSGQIKHTVTVFTDVECGFCRKFHQDIAEYNRLGIAIEYLAYPRAGMDSEDAKVMRSVWCSSDRRKALTDAKSGATVPEVVCDDSVAKQREIGGLVGLQGTPMIISSDGIALAGYLPPDKLIEALDKLASQRKL